MLADPWDSEISLAPVKRKLLEKDIQKACVAYARDHGYWARKFSSPANRSVPDYLFGKKFALCSIKWAEEFKAPKKKPTEAQIEEQDLMIAAGWRVYRDTGRRGEDDIAAFKERIQKLEVIHR